MRRVLPPLYEDSDDDTGLRSVALAAVLNTDLRDLNALRNLEVQLYQEYRHGRGGVEKPPSDEDLSILQDVLGMLRDYTFGEDLSPVDREVLAQLLVLGQFIESSSGDGGDLCIHRRRIWPDGDVDEEPFPTVRKIAADLAVTVHVIANSGGAFAVRRCPECNRWHVAAHARRTYCSDACRGRAWLARRKKRR